MRVTDPKSQEQLEALDARIEAAKSAQAPGPRGDEHYSAAQHAWRMVTELVAGLGIGFVIGYGLDHAFGTQPLFLVIFILLGFIAGVKVMLRSAQEVQAQQLAKEADRDERT